MATQFQSKQAQPQQNQEEQTAPKNNIYHTLATLFLGKRKFIEAYVNEGLKKKYPGFAEELIANFVQTISEDKRKENNLKSASSDSMIKAIFFCARKGLSLSQKQVHLALFKGALTPIISINGYRELLRRNSRVIMFQAGVRREKDLHFSIQYGSEPDLKHTPNLEEDSPIIGSYATARLREGGLVITYCNKIQLNKAKNESKSSFSKNLWATHEEEMSKVPPLRKLGKELGVDVEEYTVISSDSMNDSKSYSDNVVPFVPSQNYTAQNTPDYDYNHDYEGYPS